MAAKTLPEPAADAVCIDVPSKRDRIDTEERNRSIFLAVLYFLCGALIVTLIVFVGVRVFGFA
ncbi:MAG: hypothetical protein WC408_02600 [Candidatus Micrarchaeia archaeon]